MPTNSDHDFSGLEVLALFSLSEQRSIWQGHLDYVQGASPDPTCFVAINNLLLSQERFFLEGLFEQLVSALIAAGKLTQERADRILLGLPPE